MLTLIREGGWPIWFTLLFGVLALASAVDYTVRLKTTFGRTLGLCAATVFSALNAICADLAAVGHSVNEHYQEWAPELPRVLSQGFAESMSPGVLGFSLVCLAAFVASIGAGRRQAV